MSRKILCYDLHGSDSTEYQDVYDYIEETLNGTRATESVFIFFSSSDNKDLRDDFVGRFGNDVSVIVNDFPSGACWNEINNADKWKQKVFS